MNVAAGKRCANAARKSNTLSLLVVKNDSGKNQFEYG